MNHAQLAEVVKKVVRSWNHSEWPEWVVIHLSCGHGTILLDHTHKAQRQCRLCRMIDHD